MLAVDDSYAGIGLPRRRCVSAGDRWRQLRGTYRFRIGAIRPPLPSASDLPSPCDRAFIRLTSLQRVRAGKST